MERSIEVSKGARRTGVALSGLIVAFMVFDGVTKIVPIQAVIEACAQLGISRGSAVGIGVAALASAILYAIPRTAVLGAILLTGFLGGAVATQVLAKQPAFNMCFPVAFGVIAWLGLYLRDPRVRALAPLRELPRCDRAARADGVRVAVAA
jgi:hypothetical protein